MAKASKQATTRQGKARQNQNRNQKQAQTVRQAQQYSLPLAHSKSAQTTTLEIAGQPATKADKREMRLQRQAAVRAAAERRKRMKSLRRAGILAAVVVLLMGGLAALIIGEMTKPGQSVPEMPSPHISPNDPVPQYNSNPPTSGPHVGDVPRWQVYTEPITKQLQVHGLEDGGVIIHYKPDLDKATVDKLAGIATSYHEMESPKNHVVMAPNPDIAEPIVLTAWGRIDRLQEFDEARIRRFIDAYVGIDHHK